VPLRVSAVTPRAHIVIVVSVAALVCLTALGVLGARAGGAPVVKAALRVTLWGALAMAITAAAGALFGGGG
jgi:VIT1/CCC1 family predicted Fe2+/Mn2+ transporter